MTLNPEKINILFQSLKDYWIYLHDCDKLWIEASQEAREKEKDLMVLSDQLRCLSGQNKTVLSSSELRKTSDQITLTLEEKYSSLSSAVEIAVNTQDMLTNLRLLAETHYELLEDTNIVQRLAKNVYVSWLLFQMRSSSVSVALKNIDYKSPESIKHLLQCLSGFDNFRSELTETLEIGENLMRNLELYTFDNL